MVDTTKRYRDLFIDFDDTLYDTKGNAIQSLTEVFEYFQLNRYFKDPNDFYKPYWEINVQLWDQYAKGEIERDYLIVERFRRPLSLGVDSQGIPFSPTREFCLHVSDVFLSFCSSKSGVVEGARELMEYLKSRGYRMHLCSNGFHEVQYRKLQSSNMQGYFDTIILSEDAGANKPSPVFFEYALKKSGANRTSTLMIGDNFSTDILGAKGVGLDTMFFNRKEFFQSPESVTYEIHLLKEAISLL